MPPRISLVSESPTISISSGFIPPSEANTGAKNAADGFSAPTTSEMKIRSSSLSSPERASFLSCAIFVPFVTAHCATLPRRACTVSSACGQKTMVSPRRTWYSALKAGATAGSMPRAAKNSVKRPTRISGFVYSPRSSACHQRTLMAEYCAIISSVHSPRPKREKQVFIAARSAARKSRSVPSTSQRTALISSMARRPLLPQPRDLRSVPRVVVRRFENDRPPGKSFMADNARERLRR